MMTAVTYMVSWCFDSGKRTVRRHLGSYELTPCIEAARLIDCYPYTFDVEVNNVNTGESIDWKSPGIGVILVEETSK